MDRNVGIVAIVVGILILCCCLVGVALVGGAAFFMYQTTVTVSTQVSPFLTEVAPIFTEVYSTPAATPAIVRTPVPTPLPGGQDTLAALNNEIVPQGDARELAMRLKGLADVPEVVSTTPANYAIGNVVEFNVSNSDTDEQWVAKAELIYATQNAYFFAEKGLNPDQGDVKNLLDEFQNTIYPTDREFFGSEWIPGVDGDPHVYILYVSNLGANTAGYYNSQDEYSHLAYKDSNEKEMFYLNADANTPDDAYMRSTLAHEFQHMIMWYHDHNEETWMAEGSAQLAEDLNHYELGSQFSFLEQPDLQLNTWTDLGSDPETYAHYDAAYLYMKYFQDRFGPQVTQTLIADPANGMEAVNNTLTAIGATDPGSGQTLTANGLFADWVVANYLNDRDVAGGQYGYADYNDQISRPTATIKRCPYGPDSESVHQYAADYWAITCAGTFTLNFTGSQQTQVVPTELRGRYAFWGNRADDSDTLLTREFDLTGVSSATLTFWGWWQIEKNFDYAYLEVSPDGGQTWKIIRTPSGTADDPYGSNQEWGYTGCSGGGDPGEGCNAKWIQEKVDLSEFAGQKILVRFEYITDAGLNYPGLMLDDLTIPEIQYSCDFEASDCGWDGQGFVRMDNLLPQTYVVQIIRQAKGQTTVEQLPLDASNQGHLTFDLVKGETAVLVVSGVTPYTTEEASYQFEIAK